MSNFGLARETGLDGATKIARSLEMVAKSIDRLAAAVEKDRRADRQPVGLVIRTEQVEQ